MGYGTNAGTNAQAEGDFARQSGQTNQTSLQRQGQTAYTNYGRLADLAGQRQQANASSVQSQFGDYGSAAYGQQTGNATQAYQRNAGLAGQSMAQGNAAAGAGYRIGGQLQGYGGQANTMAGTYGDRASTDYGTQAQGRAEQLAALDALRGFADRGPGPSAAQAQLQQASDANMAQSIALARSGRGAGENAAAMRNAQFQNAATQQATAGQMSTLRAQEEQAWRGQQLQALSELQSGAGAVRGQDIGAMGTNIGAQGQAGNLAQGYMQSGAQTQMQGLGLQQGYAGQAQGYQQLGQGAEQAYNSLGAQLQQGYTTTGAQLGQGYEQLGQSAEQSYNQFGGQQAAAYTAMGHAADQYGQSLRNQILTSDMSDITNRRNTSLGVFAQKDIAEQQIQQQKEAAGMALFGSLMGGIGGAMSDERQKSKIAKSGGPLEMLDGLRSYSYEYRDTKEPGTAPGRQYGVTAQDLERSPAGRSVVRDTPHGKMVDTNHLTLVNTAALAEMQREIDALRAGRAE